ncbi:hypothetical protein K1X84_14815 [bacterium]|nr:hypothetical protein [bacterium]
MKFFLKMILVYLFFLGSLYSQESEKHLERFFIVLKSSERIEGNHGILSDEQFDGQKNNGKKFTIKKNEISSLYVAKGSKAMKLSFLGSLMGLVIGIGSIVIDKDGVTQNSTSIKTIVGLTIGGGLVGGLIGISETKWERVIIK